MLVQARRDRSRRSLGERGRSRSCAPRSSASCCHGTKLAWCSSAVTTISSPARTLARPHAVATRLMRLGRAAREDQATPRRRRRGSARCARAPRGSGRSRAPTARRRRGADSRCRARSTRASRRARRAASATSPPSRGSGARGLRGEEREVGAWRERHACAPVPRPDEHLSVARRATSNTASGSVAGPRRTSPVRQSNRAPCHAHSIVPSSSSVPSHIGNSGAGRCRSRRRSSPRKLYRHTRSSRLRARHRAASPVGHVRQRRPTIPRTPCAHCRSVGPRRHRRAVPPQRVPRRGSRTSRAPGSARRRRTRRAARGRVPPARVGRSLPVTSSWNVARTAPTLRRASFPSPLVVMIDADALRDRAPGARERHVVDPIARPS